MSTERDELREEMREEMRDRARRITTFIVGGLIIMPFILALFGWIVRQLWNWLMPALFALPAITFWQALGLMALSWILFGGLRGTAGRGFGGRRHWRRRWERLTPEQRAELLQSVEGRCGHRRARSEDANAPA